MWIALRYGCIIVALVSLTGCSAEKKPMPVKVEFGGCLTVLEGPVCVLDKNHTVLLWLRPATNAAVRFHADSHPLQPQSTTPVQGGNRYELQLPDGARLLALTIDDAGQTYGWRIALKTKTDPPWLSEALTLFRAGDMDATRKILEQALTQPNLTRRADAIGLLGKIALRAGQRDVAIEKLREAMQLSRGTGRDYDALRFGMVLVFALQTDKQTSAADTVLDSFAEIGNGHAESSYFLAYHRGLAASDFGDARAALRQLSRAADIAERFGWQRRQLNGEQMLAVQLQELGRRNEARALLDSWVDRLPAELHDCEKGLYYTNVGWSELLRLEAGEQANDPLPALQQALLLAANCSPDQLANTEFNLALAWLHAGNTDNAAAHLSAARAATQKPALRLVLWLLDIEARIATAGKDYDRARVLLEQLERLAAATLSPTARWRASIGQALLAQQAGDTDEALAAFEAAESLLEKDLNRVPLSEGRESLMAARQWATQRHMQTLLSAGEVRKAYQLARRTRQRLFYSLSPAEQIKTLDPQQRQKWETAVASYREFRDQIRVEIAERWAIPADELARIDALRVERQQQVERMLDDALAAIRNNASDLSLKKPSEDQLLIAFHKIESDWLVFIDNGSDIQVLHRRCDLRVLARQDQASCLLAPVSTEIAAARQVVFLPTGAINDIDFHAMSVGNDVLLSGVEVVYSNDLSARTAPPPTAAVALIVGDPLGDLPGARGEARRVQALLSADADWSAKLLTGNAALAGDIQKRLQQSTLFHFAGHAAFSGERGWDSELRLAGGSSLTVTDILALTQPPSLVVLSGCETAAVADDRLPQSIGLANAFLSSGSTVVVAATRVVSDQLTDALMQGFYRRWTSGASLPAALRGAQLELRADDPGADWAAFRLIQR